MNFGNIQGLVSGVDQIVFDREITAGEGAQSSISTGNILNGDEDGWYVGIIRFNSGANAECGLQFNGDTGANYGIRGIQASNTSVGDASGTGQTNPLFVYGNTNHMGFAVFRMYAKSGAVRLINYMSAKDVYGTTVNYLNTGGIVWNNTADNITSMAVVCGSANILAGSRFTLLKSNNFTGGTPTGSITTPYIKGAWVRVGSQTSAGALTSMTFTGLDGDRDVLYYGSFYIYQNTSSDYLNLTCNTDTGASYGHQFLAAQNTTVSADRPAAQAAIFLDPKVGSSQGYAQFHFLMFAKSGFVRPLITWANDNISGTTIGNITVAGQVWSNTADNITQLVLKQSGPYWGPTGPMELYALRPNG